MENQHQLIVYYSPTIFWGPLVIKLKKLWKSNTYLILRDIFPQWVIDQGILKEKSLITKYFKFFEKINHFAADTIGVQSKSNLDWFIKNKKTKKSIEILNNWVNEKNFCNEKSINREKLGLVDKIVFFYGGNIGHAQDMMNIIRLANNLRNDKKAHFVVVGDGDEVVLFLNAIKKYKLTNITYMPPVSQQEYKKILSEFDIGLFSLHSAHQTHNFPGKLLDYMVEKKPILGSVNFGNDIKTIIEDNYAGLISYNGDDDLFLKNARELLNSKSLREKVGGNSYLLLLKHFSVKYAACQILRACK